MIKSKSYIWLLLILSFSFLFSEKNTKDIQKSIDKKNKEAELLKSEIDRLAKEIQNKNVKSKALTNKLSDINKKIELTGNLIDLLKKDESNIHSSIINTEKSIDKNKIKLDKLKLKFSKMILHLYKTKSDNYLDILLNSKNWEDMIYKVKYLEILSEQHQKIKKDIELVVNELDNDIIILTSELLNKKNDRKIKSNQIAEYGLISEKEKNKLKKIENEKTNLEKNEADKKNKLTEINQLLKKLYTDKEEAKKREEKLKKIREQKKKQLESAQKIKGFSRMKGELPWPVEGTIIKNFGIEKTDGVEDMNICIEIKTKKDEEVRTVFDGIVATIDYNLVYNTYIVIDHGDGYSTLYANLDDDSIKIKKQAYIDSNTIIGKTLNKSNNKNQSYGLLYFGILQMKNNQEVVPSNPREWIK